MLFIPMFMDVDCFVPDDDDPVVCYRYSPLTRYWWRHEWETGEFSVITDIKTDIRTTEDLKEALEMMQTGRNGAVPYQTHVDYWACISGPEGVKVSYIKYPLSEKRLPWNSGSVTESFLDYGPSSCWESMRVDENTCVSLFHLFEHNNKDFLIHGVIRFWNRLKWRMVRGYPIPGKTTTDGRPVYNLDGLDWVFCRDGWCGMVGDSPAPESFKITVALPDEATPKPQMTGRQENETALNLLLIPGP